MVTRTAKFDRIDIWRNEVASSQTYCVCSAPALQSKVSGVHERSGSSVGISSITAPATPTGLKQGNTQFTVASWSDRKKRPRPKFLSLGSGSDLSDRFRRSEGGDCFMCASPTDGVEYKSLSSDGSGLVWRMNDASRSISSSLKRLEEGEKAKSNRPLLNRISQVFRHTKKSSESLGVITVPGGSKTTTADWSGKIPGRSTGTEMYYLLRREKRLDVAIDKEAEDKTVGGPSEDSGKKPKIGIEESAARLERAQRMLVSGAP